MVGYIYKISNDINDKVYIGKTLDSLEARLKIHFKDCYNRKYEKRPLYNAMNKYGIWHFKIDLVEECDAKVLSEREIYWINYYNSYYKGYNATFGGDGKQLYDYDLIIELYLQGLTGVEIAKELNCDASVVHKALINSGFDTNKNKLLKIGKKVAAYNLNNELLKTFDSMSDAGRWLVENNITTATIKSISNAIARVASGKRETAYKLKWQWV